MAALATLAPPGDRDPFDIPASERTAEEAEFVHEVRRSELLQEEEAARYTALLQNEQLQFILEGIDASGTVSERSLTTALLNNLGIVDGVSRLNDRLRLAGMADAMLGGNMPAARYGQMILNSQLWWAMLESSTLPPQYQDLMFREYVTNMLSGGPPGMRPATPQPHAAPQRPNQPQAEPARPTPPPYSRFKGEIEKRRALMVDRIKKDPRW